MPATSTGTGAPAARRRETVAGGRLDADNTAAILHPCGLAGDETAAADRDQQRIVVADLIVEFDGHRALPGDDRWVLEGVDRQGAGLGLTGAARPLGIVVVPIDDVHVGAEALDPFALDRRARARHEDLGGEVELLGDEGNSGAVVAAGRGDQPRLADFAGGHRAEHPVERAAGLERTGVLQQLQLEGHRMLESQLAPANLDHRRLSHPRPNAIQRRDDVVRPNCRTGCCTEASHVTTVSGR